MVESVYNRLMNFTNQSIILRNNNEEGITEKQAKDNVTTSLVSDLVTVMENNMYGVWLDNFKNYKQLDAKGLEESLHLKPGEGVKMQKQLDSFIKRAERIKSSYDFGVNNIADKKIDLTKIPKNTPEYDKAAIYNKALDQSLWNLVFFQESFTDNLERVNGLFEL